MSFVSIHQITGSTTQNIGAKFFPILGNVLYSWHVYIVIRIWVRLASKNVCVIFIFCCWSDFACRIVLQDFFSSTVSTAPEVVGLSRLSPF